MRGIYPRLLASLQERNHVIVCLLLGAAATALPLYDITQVEDGPDEEWLVKGRSGSWMEDI